ncbi:MAG TPA: hypothetical protein VFT06_10235 [Flavisolibacter sp.]|nr:hypothetical protein [Flavisolibacter sp.]
MIDVNKQVRTAIVSLLDGAVTIDGVPVPCYHWQNPAESDELYIVLHTQTGENNSNMAANEVIGTIMIDVVHLTDGSTFDTVDTVCNAVKTLLEPTVTGIGITDPDGLQVWNFIWLSDNEQPFYSESGNVMRRLMRYEYKVNIL